MSEITTPVVAETTPNPTAPSGDPVINPGRASLIEKYEQMYAAPPAEAEVVTPVEETQAPVTPEPVVTAPVVDKDAMLLQMMEEIKALKQVAQTTPVAQPTVTPAEPEDWLKLLSEGKKSEGELALARVLGPQLKNEAVQEALALMQAERQVSDYTAEVRQKNTDVLSMEPYIAMAANARIEQARQQGLIKSPADYVTVYKQAVNAEIENARKLAQTLRGAGKVEATVRQAEVVAQRPIAPNPVNLQREQPNTTTEPEIETAQTYLAKRQAMQQAGRGLQ